MPNFTCKTCSIVFYKPPCRGYVPYCNNKCYKKSGASNPKWKGGTYANKGYIYQYAPEHPQATKLGYVLQHRLVMEAHIQRFLLPSEVVHHLNENKADNRIENLVCCASTGAHSAEHHNKRGANGQFILHHT
jgi:hypothetical protein